MSGTSHRPPSVLVTGATGLVGRELVASLSADGVRPRVLLRRPHPEAAALGLDVALGDLRVPASLTAAVAGIDTIFHCAGMMHAAPAAGADPWHAVNAAGSAALADAAAAAGVRRFVHVSSIAVYGDQPLDGVDEDHAPSPSDAYGRSKLAAERQLAARDDLAWVVLRPCAIYRPGVTPFVSQWIRWALEDRFPLARGGATLVSLVHVADVVAALRRAADVDAAVGRTYHVAEGARRSLADVRALLAGLLGRPVGALAVDGPLGRMRLRLSPVAGPRGRLDPLVLSVLQQDRHVLVDRARTELGWAPTHDLAAGLATTLSSLGIPEAAPCSS